MSDSRDARARPSFVNTQVFSQLDMRLHLEMELGKRPAGTRRLEGRTRHPWASQAQGAGGRQGADPTRASTREPEKHDKL